MPVNLPLSPQCAAANAAREKAAAKHKIAKHIADHYAMTRQGLCQPDIIRQVKAIKSTVNRAVRELVNEKRVKFIGYAVDAGREDIAPNVRMYGPMDAVMISRGYDKRRAINVGAAVETVPPPVRRNPRTGSGQIGGRYQPEWRELTPAEHDWRDVAAMRMLCRG